MDEYLRKSLFAESTEENLVRQVLCERQVCADQRIALEQEPLAGQVVYAEAYSRKLTRTGRHWLGCVLISGGTQTEASVGPAIQAPALVRGSSLMRDLPVRAAGMAGILKQKAKTPPGLPGGVLFFVFVFGFASKAKNPTRITWWGSAYCDYLA
jgi:hypothetical protein